MLQVQTQKSISQELLASRLIGSTLNFLWSQRGATSFAWDGFHLFSWYPKWELEVSRTLPYFPFRIIWQVRLWCLGSGQTHCLSLLLLDAVQHIMEDGPSHPILIKIGKKPAIPLCTGIYSPCSNSTHIFFKKNNKIIHNNINCS